MPTDDKAVPDGQATQLVEGNRFQLELTDVRVNSLALQAWLHRFFLIREGVPVPVIFTGPMDAFAQFNRLWKEPNNPYGYLVEKKEFPGLEPAPLQYPLIGVDFKRMHYRAEQSYASRVNRRRGWPTVSSVADGLTLSDLANVTQVRYPAAYTYVFQLDFYCARPDTQAFFIRQLTRAFKVMSAGEPQTYITVVYPGYEQFNERVVLASDIEDMTEKEPADNEMRYRTSLTLNVEGYAADLDRMTVPTLWQTIAGVSLAVAPADLLNYLNTHGVNDPFDLRVGPVQNPIVVQRAATMPPAAN